MDFIKLYKTFEQEPAFRLRQVEKAVFCDAVEDWDEVTVLSKAMRERLKEECPLEIRVEQVELIDKNVQKAVFKFRRHQEPPSLEALGASGMVSTGDRVEAVLMRHPDRNTVCVSSQIGCALQCKFCATGKLGLSRNLTAWEIVEQVLFFSRLLKKEDKRVTNVVFMGMGEPFQNYDAVMKAVRTLNDQDKFAIGARKISISTVGVVDGIKRLAKEEVQVNLAVSLHAPNDELRTALMPINKSHSLRQLLETTAAYIDSTKRRVMIEYVMLSGVNDSVDQAKELAGLLKKYLGHLFVVNLIRYNQTGEFSESDAHSMKKFKIALEKEKVDTVERYRFGDTIKAACGQLGSISN